MEQQPNGESPDSADGHNYNLISGETIDPASFSFCLLFFLSLHSRATEEDLKGDLS